MTAGRRHRSGQSLTEVALVLPVLLALIFGGIDYGGYFASRLSVENAARVAVRAAAVDVCPITGVGVTQTGNTSCWSNATAPVSGTIERIAMAAAADANILNKDCPDSDSVWPPSAADLATLTPGTGCVSIRYYYLNGSTQSLCANWSATNDEMTTQTLYPMGTDCVIPAASTGADVVQVVIGYNYSPLIPIPWFKGSGLTTTAAETQLVLEQG
ncbi:MAG: TadE/TadG family type IV pilus assembly protein [Candidatus Dormibacteria bacterium]